MADPPGELRADALRLLDAYAAAFWRERKVFIHRREMAGIVPDAAIERVFELLQEGAPGPVAPS